jgi:hypothetical protein
MSWQSMMPVGADAVKCISAYSKELKGYFAITAAYFGTTNAPNLRQFYRDPPMRYLILTNKMSVKKRLRLLITLRYYSNKIYVIFSVLRTDTELMCKRYIVCY